MCNVTKNIRENVKTGEQTVREYDYQNGTYTEQKYDKDGNKIGQPETGEIRADEGKSAKEFLESAEYDADVNLKSKIEKRPDGSTIETFPNGGKIIRDKNGDIQETIYPDGTRRLADGTEITPDGLIIYPPAHKETYYYNSNLQRIEKPKPEGSYERIR